MINSERFWAKVNKTDTCWLWTGSLSTNGYGQVGVGGTTKRAHRISYELAGGTLIAGMEIDHLCSVRRCVNPAHLEQVTGEVNRSRAPLARSANAAKTHCKHGHEFTAASTYRDRDGARVCRPCGAASERRRRANSRPPSVHGSRPPSDAAGELQSGDRQPSATGRGATS